MLLKGKSFCRFGGNLVARSGNGKLLLRICKCLFLQRRLFHQKFEITSYPGTTFQIIRASKSALRLVLFSAEKLLRGLLGFEILKSFVVMVLARKV